MTKQEFDLSMVERNGRALPADIAEVWENSYKQRLEPVGVGFLKGFLVGIPLALVMWALFILGFRAVCGMF